MPIKGEPRGVVWRGVVVEPMNLRDFNKQGVLASWGPGRVKQVAAKIERPNLGLASLTTHIECEHLSDTDL